MIILLLSTFLLITLAITQVAALIPIHLFQALHIPMWLFWGGLAIALSWLMGD
ncbi:MAG: hypothetical protein AAFR31_02455 [Cyanobacteria bacterium J06627_8]